MPNEGDFFGGRLPDEKPFDPLDRLRRFGEAPLSRQIAHVVQCGANVFLQNRVSELPVVDRPDHAAECNEQGNNRRDGNRQCDFVSPDELATAIGDARRTRFHRAVVQITIDVGGK